MKNILIFNDISGLGNCSMATNLPVLTALGHYCMPMPTACYSCQTGFDSFSVLKNDKIEQFTKDILSNRKPDAVYVGFCNDTQTLNSILSIIKKLKNEGALVIVDPIMGDNGKLYPVFDDSYVALMREVLSFADVITPNVTEACLLCNIEYEKVSQTFDTTNGLEKIAKTFNTFLHSVDSVVITGIPCGQNIGNIVCDQKLSFVENKRVDVNYSGTGDLFSSVLAGKLLNGYNLTNATKTAAEFVGLSAAVSECKDRRFGVEFGKVLSKLIDA